MSSGKPYRLLKYKPHSTFSLSKMALKYLEQMLPIALFTLFKKGESFMLQDPTCFGLTTFLEFKIILTLND